VKPVLAPVSCERRRLRRDPEDLRAIGAQQRELFASCE